MDSEALRKELKVRKLLYEIIDGFSSVLIDKEVFFIKHLTEKDKVKILEKQINFIENLKKKSIPTFAEKLKSAESIKQWTKRQNRDYEMALANVEALEQTKNKLIVSSQKEEVEKELAEERKKLFDLEKIRNGIFYGSIEYFSNKREIVFFTEESFFRDSALSEKVFTKKFLEDNDEKSFSKFSNSLFEKIVNFSEESLQEIALNNSFQSFWDTSNNFHEIFNKKIIEATSYQINLFRNASYFGKIFDRYPELPFEIRQNPKEIFEWIERFNAQQKYKNKGANTNVVGATSSDLEKSGLSQPNQSLINRAKKGEKIGLQEAALSKAKN